MKGLVVVTLLILSAGATSQNSVTVREASKGNFIATLLSQSELSIEEAQSRLLVSAAETCKGSIPNLGHYEFTSSKSINSPSQVVNQFKFEQEFTCTKSAAITASQTEPTVISEPDKERLVKLVTHETQNFLESANSATLEAFHSRFSDQLRLMLPRGEWTDQQALQHKKSGTIRENPQFKVTAYVDPPNSPGPGVYLAVDFQAQYEHAPFRCGYVMWLFDQQSNLSVLRIEDGIVYEQDAAAMTTDQISQMKATFRCFAP